MYNQGRISPQGVGIPEFPLIWSKNLSQFGFRIPEIFNTKFLQLVQTKCSRVTERLGLELRAQLQNVRTGIFPHWHFSSPQVFYCTLPLMQHQKEKRINFDTVWEPLVSNCLQRQLGPNPNNNQESRNYLKKPNPYLSSTEPCSDLGLLFSSLLQACYFIFEKQSLTVLAFTQSGV